MTLLFTIIQQNIALEKCERNTCFLQAHAAYHVMTFSFRFAASSRRIVSTMHAAATVSCMTGTGHVTGLVST